MSKTWTTPLTTSILILSTLYSSTYFVNGKIHPEFDLTFEQRVIRHGYPIETHQVVTEDDYILALYHIPHGQTKEAYPNDKNKSVVVIVHGMGGCPHNFIVLGPKKSAPYHFSDNGMDVWLFASRGLRQRFKNHKTLDWDKDDEFWLHSFHEIGKYDLTATIDYIYNYTGHKKMALIGHSAGGNEFFCMFSEKPQYNEKVKAAISWGSSPIIKRMDYPLMRLGILAVDIIKAIVKYYEMAELFPIVQTLKLTLKVMCADPEWQTACTMGTWVVGSHKSVLQRPNDVQLIISNIPRIASRQILHFMDNINNGTFRKYDHGPRENMKRYGQRDPPHYNLSATTVPTAFFSAPSDSEIVKADVLDAISRLPNTVLLYDVPFQQFTHLDYIFAINATELVYEPTYRFLKDIDNGIIPPPIKVPPVPDLDY